MVDPGGNLGVAWCSGELSCDWFGERLECLIEWRGDECYLEEGSYWIRHGWFVL